MAANSGTQSRRQRFDELMQAGEQALASGDRRTAHDRWREAATIDPYDEQVWMSLLRVLDDEEDRRVCLENIIAINPMNVQARRLLHRDSSTAIPIVATGTESATQPARPDAAPPRPKQRTTTQQRAATTTGSSKKAQAQKQKQKSKKAPPKARPKRSIGRIIGLVIGALVIAVLLALVLSLVVFGRG